MKNECQRDVLAVRLLCLREALLNVPECQQVENSKGRMRCKSATGTRRVWVMAMGKSANAGMSRGDFVGSASAAESQCNGWKAEEQKESEGGDRRKKFERWFIWIHLHTAFFFFCLVQATVCQMERYLLAFFLWILTKSCRGCWWQSRGAPWSRHGTSHSKRPVRGWGTGSCRRR